MGWSESEIVCGKHPDETPQPGICPSCLTERLSRIIGKYSTTSDRVFPSSPSPPIYYYGCYSASSSAGSSPARCQSQRHRHLRMASDVMDSIYVALGGAGAGGLKKSRSMVNYAPARDDGVNKKKKKRGFWNKLLLRSIGNKSKLW